MGSPSMDREAGYQQARLDLMRHDMFAIVNHTHKVLDWNQDQSAWVAGYQEFLLTNADALTVLDTMTSPTATPTEKVAAHA